MADGVVRRLPVKRKDGSIELIEIESIFYLEAKGHDTLIRTRRKKPYHSVQRLGELAKKLGKTPEDAAEGILSVANTAMERALRVISVERGFDPAEFVLVAF